jgi:benzoyl-CoA reductase/2-hydroxyglutaryl-CoA dehydratase subunit BcrC/BadD/HgdB
LSDAELSTAIARANGVRRILGDLRQLCFTAPVAPLPALEMLVAEMMAIHFCSDPAEVVPVLQELHDEAAGRVAAGVGVTVADAVPVFWVNPVADLCAMNLLEEVGGRICGTDYLFSHALDTIPTDVPPLEALAQMALSDPMVGSTADRAARITADVQRFGARAVVIARIPGASHCAFEGDMIGEALRTRLGVPVLEIEVPSITDALRPTLRTRLEALVETARDRSRA